MVPEIVETSKNPDTDAVRKFKIRCDKSTALPDVLAIDGLPKLNERRKNTRCVVTEVRVFPCEVHPLLEHAEWAVDVTYEVRSPRKVLMFICDRANWGRLEPLAAAIQERDDLELQVLAGGSSVLKRFGRAADQLPNVVSEVYSEIEGSLLLTQARSCGLAMMDYAAEFHRLKPDLLLLVGDRYQALAAATAAATMRIPMLHIQGGEISQCADNKYRHMITKAADFHWPATEKAMENLLRMAEPESSIIGLGCPGSDIAAQIDVDDEADGPILCIYHPNTSEPGSERQQMLEVLHALQGVPGRVLCWWPNVDAGSDEVGKAIRIWMDEYKSKGLDLGWFETVKNMTPDKYLEAVANARCLCGNSSSFARDSSYFGTPCVLVGKRQAGRETGPNVTPVACERTAIREAVEMQLEHGRYPLSDVYGDGEVSERIAEALATMDLSAHKELTLA